MGNWFPNNKEELERILGSFLSYNAKTKTNIKDIHGLIVPHAGYEYSELVAGFKKQTEPWEVLPGYAAAEKN